MGAAAAAVAATFTAADKAGGRGEENGSTVFTPTKNFPLLFLSPLPVIYSKMF